MQRLPSTFLAASGAFLLACGGLDPNDYGAQPSLAPNAGQAGYSYDAGVSAAGGSPRGGAGGQPGSSGGSGGNSTGPRSGVGNAPGEAGASSGSEAEGDAGESGLDHAGGASDGGVGGTDPQAGRAGSGAGQGGAPGQAGSWSWGGRGGAPAGGRAGAGGGAGRSTGGASGAAGHAGSAGRSDSGPDPIHDLVFSEYVEGARAKALEIRAGQASTLTGCELVTYFDKGTVRRIALTGEVESGDVYVLCLQLELVDSGVCDRKTDLRFNGDDAIALECGGVALDVIGRIGEDPGTAWEANGASTAEQTLRRRCSASHGDTDGTDAFDPSAQWLPLPAGTVDGLGQAACGEPTTTD